MRSKVAILRLQALTLLGKDLKYPAGLGNVWEMLESSRYPSKDP